MSKHIDLQGLRVLNTRPASQAKALNQAIQAAKGRAISCPMLAIEPLALSAWIETLPPLSTVSQAIFTSSNAVHCFFTALTQRAIAWPKAITVIAIGKATATALQTHGITPDAIPLKADSEHLLALPSLQHPADQTLLLIKGVAGRPLIADTLTARGGNLLAVSVYRRTLPTLEQSTLSRLWQTDAADIIVFTSEEAIHNCFVLFGKEAHTWLQEKPCLVISQRLAESAAKFGIKDIRVCEPDTLMTALQQFSATRKNNA